jgi:hypothetical protein
LPSGPPREGNAFEAIFEFDRMTEVAQVSPKMADRVSCGEGSSIAFCVKGMPIEVLKSSF